MSKKQRWQAIFIPTLPLFVSDGDERVQTGDADGNLTMSVKLDDMQSCMSSANSNRLLEEEMQTQLCFVYASQLEIRNDPQWNFWTLFDWYQLVLDLLA